MDENYSDDSDEMQPQFCLTRNISDVFKDYKAGNVTVAMPDFNPTSWSPSAIDFSKVDMSKIPLELLTSNLGYLKDISATNSLPVGLEDLIKGHEKDDEKCNSSVTKNENSIPPTTAFLLKSDSVPFDEEDELSRKMKEVFHSISFSDDGEILIDLVSFITGLRVLGLDEMNDIEIGEIYSDFIDDNAAEVNFQKIMADMNSNKTDRIRRFRELLCEILGIFTPAKKLELQLEDLSDQITQKSSRILELEKKRNTWKENHLRDVATKNKLLEHEIRSLQDSLMLAQTNYKSELVVKANVVDFLQSQLEGSEERRETLEEQLRQWEERKPNAETGNAMEMTDELANLKKKASQAEQHFREKLEGINERGNKYKTKYEKLKERSLEMKAIVNTEKKDTSSEIHTLRFQLRLIEEKTKHQKGNFKSYLNDIAEASQQVHAGMKASDLFSKHQDITITESGEKQCTTLWKFVSSDMYRHTIRMMHVQGPEEIDSKARCRRVIQVDGEEHYNKKSNSKHYLFQIDSDEVGVVLAFENTTWKYNLLINGQSFTEAKGKFNLPEEVVNPSEETMI